MFSFRSILDDIREVALACIGSPQSRTRQLAALRKLDAHLLKDIGLTPEEAREGHFIARRRGENAPRSAGLMDSRTLPQPID